MMHIMGRLIATATILALHAACTMVDAPRAETSSVEVEGPVESVIIRIDAGSLWVKGGESGAAVVEHEIQWSEGNRPTVSQALEGSVLTVEATCPEPGSFDCRIDLEVSVPTTATLEIDAGASAVLVQNVASVRGQVASGDVQIERIEGPVELESASGDVVCDRLQDAMWVDASAGAILGTRLRVNSVYASTQVGRIDLELERLGSRATLTSRSGDILLGLSDAQEYWIEAISEQGEVYLDLEPDAEASVQVYAATVTGDVEVWSIPSVEAED